MVYGILRRLESEGSLGKCSISLSRKDVAGGKDFIFGRDIVSMDRSCIIVTGGETGHEEARVPLERIKEIESEGRVIFRRKGRIEKVYPRR